MAQRDIRSVSEAETVISCIHVYYLSRSSAVLVIPLKYCVSRPPCFLFFNVRPLNNRCITSLRGYLQYYFLRALRALFNDSPGWGMLNLKRSSSDKRCVVISPPNHVWGDELKPAKQQFNGSNLKSAGRRWTNKSSTSSVMFLSYLSKSQTLPVSLLIVISKQGSVLPTPSPLCAPSGSWVTGRRQKEKPSSSPSLRAKINFLVCRDGGQDCPRVDEKVEWSELIMGCPHAIHLAGLGSSTEDTKKLVLQLFQGRSPQSGSSSEWLNEWMSECT